MQVLYNKGMKHSENVDLQYSIPRTHHCRLRQRATEVDPLDLKLMVGWPRPANFLT